MPKLDNPIRQQPTPTEPTEPAEPKQERGAAPRVAAPKTFSPDPTYLDVGAGTAAAQTARPRMLADHVNGGWDPAPIAATGATAGIPGAWTPAGAVVPANLAAVTSAGIVATPATAWTIGQYVATTSAHVHWSGSAWVTGDAP